jgi:hypothetical protein
MMLSICMTCLGCNTKDNIFGSDWVQQSDPNYMSAPGQIIVYNDETLPKVALPTREPAQLENLSPPWVQMGMDTGEPGVMYSAALSGYFLLRMQQEDGSYKYEYRPDTGEFFWQDVIHRQVGPGYAAALLYEELGRVEFRLSAERVFEYAIPRLQTIGLGNATEDTRYRLTDIGATSILIFGLSRLVRSTSDADSKWHEYLRGLGRHLLQLQNADGSFQEGSPLARGQAIQALAHLWLTYQEQDYLTALQKTAKYSCDSWEAIDREYLPYFILYANEALATLYSATSDSYLPGCVYDMTEVNMEDQYLADDTANVRWIGGFNKSANWTPSWSASLKLEAIADALVIARLANDREYEDLYEERIRLGVPFVQRFQWRIGETASWPNPDVVLGGFPYLAEGSGGDLAWPLSRTDLSWHGTAFLVKAARVLGDEYWPNRPEKASD